MNRREVATKFGLAAVAALCGCTAVPPNISNAISSIAPGVYAFKGSAGPADERNLGRVGNAGFIVGKHGVIAIDTGTSHAHGQVLLTAIRAVTDLPVRLALITHTRPEFLFGGGAFQECGVPVRMHTGTARLMAARCDICLKTLRQTVGDDAMRHTAMYKADQEFDANHRLDSIGRSIQILYFGHSSGPGDIAVLDEQTGVLFAGGLLDAQRIPDIQDSHLPAWKLALQELERRGISQVVPGHGPVSPASLVSRVQDYLVQLETRARLLVTAGTSLLDVSEAGELPEFERWDQYDTIHRRNSAIAFVRFERDLLLK